MRTQRHEPGRGRCGRRSGSRGAAAVEFALVVPILIVLAFGIISYGFMLSFRQSVSQAAAEGARAAAVAPVTADRVAIAKAAIGKTLNATCGSALLTCTVTTAPAVNPTTITVLVDWNYDADTSKPKLLFNFALPSHLAYTSVSGINQ